jgi:hypothetical protein
MHIIDIYYDISKAGTTNSHAQYHSANKYLLGYFLEDDNK